LKENEILSRVKCFDRQALAEVYDTYSDGLYAYAFRLLRDRHMAEDCVSDTFTRFLNALQTGKGPDKYLQAYLYRIAHNWITDIFRRQPIPALSLDENILSPVGDEATESEVVKLMIQEQMLAALRRLPPTQQQVILLKYIEGWENEQVAAVLQKPVGAVKSLQHRALENLRGMLVSNEEIKL
jgi:RNA polymerase sigma-70 factor (ECF subfamily)